MEDGDAPMVDLATEKLHGDFVLANRKTFAACTDLGDGGLALAAFEMAEGAGLGLMIDAEDIGFLFGEDQARYLVALPQTRLKALSDAAKTAGVPLALVGQFGGTTVSLGGDTAPLSDLSDLYRHAFAKAVG